MGKEKSKITMKQTMGRQEAINLLADLVKSLEAGKIVVEQGKKFLSLTPGEKIHVEVEAKQKKDKGELTIHLSCELVTEVPVEPEEAPLRISSQEPKMPQEPEVSESEEGDENAAKGGARRKQVA